MPAGKKAAFLVLANREISPNTQGNSTRVGTTRVAGISSSKADSIRHATCRLAL